MKTLYDFLLWYVWYGGLNGSDPRKWQKIHNFSKIKRIRKIFSEYNRLRIILHFCFLEYRATTLPCCHMGPWYTTHMVPEWYYTKMGINRLEIDWRVIFESISINFNKWFHYTIIALTIITCWKRPKMEYLQMTIKDDRLIPFSNGFQYIIQLDKGFRLVYNMSGIGYQMVTWPYELLPFGTIWCLISFDSKLSGNK